MLSVLVAQSPAPDAGAWTVTTVIALIGAVISLATLIVTTWAAGRRERAKWARESLAEAFFDFVDTSYTAATAASRQYRELRSAADLATLAASEIERERQHSLLRHHLTKIRLLAPVGTVERAQVLRRAHAHLAHAIASDLDEESFHELRGEVARAREEFVVSAKKAMSLPR